jgi:hypothetical protein
MILPNYTRNMNVSTQKHTHFVKDHQRNIPVMISVKCLKRKEKKEVCPVVIALSKMDHRT